MKVGEEHSNIWSLLAEIDTLRDALEEAYAEEGVTSPKVLLISQKLDTRISRYLKLKEGW